MILFFYALLTSTPVSCNAVRPRISDRESLVNALAGDPPFISEGSSLAACKPLPIALLPGFGGISGASGTKIAKDLISHRHCSPIVLHEPLYRRWNTSYCIGSVCLFFPVRLESDSSFDSQSFIISLPSKAIPPDD